jgi:hypothetical protein
MLMTVKKALGLLLVASPLLLLLYVFYASHREDTGDPVIDERARSEIAEVIHGQTGFITVTSLADLPPALKKHLGEISDVGGPFASGCISDGVTPHMRFTAGAKRDHTYILAIESGGESHGVDVATYEILTNGSIHVDRFQPR